MFFFDVNFRLLELELRGNNIFGDMTFSYVDIDDLLKSQERASTKSPYFSVIIGANGTGKSNFLRLVIDLFSELKYLKETGKRTNEVIGKFRLRYTVGEKEYVFTNINIIDTDVVILKRKDNISYSIDGILEPDLSQAVFPERILACTIMLTDKFPSTSEEGGFYKYLGVRRENSRTVAGTQSYIRRTVDFIADKLEDEIFLDKVGKMLDFLYLSRSFKIIYHPKFKKDIFTRNLTIEEFKRFFEEFWKIEGTKRTEDKPPYSVQYYRNEIQGKPELIQRLVEECNLIV